jgi:hypothetical protein
MRTFGIAVIVSGMLLTSCAQSTPGTALTTSPTSTSAPATTTTNVGGDVPQVANPLDVAKFEQNACSLLTPARAREVANLVTNRVDNSPAGQICHWSDDHRDGVSLSLVRGGLRNAYGKRDYPSGYFEVAPDVLGYPAVYTSISDGRPDGTCTIGVGVRNDIALAVSSFLSSSSTYFKSPCQLVSKAAEAAVATIKEGA